MEVSLSPQQKGHREEENKLKKRKEGWGEVCHSPTQRLTRGRRETISIHTGGPSSSNESKAQPVKAQPVKSQPVCAPDVVRSNTVGVFRQRFGEQSIARCHLVLGLSPLCCCDGCVLSSFITHATPLFILTPQHTHTPLLSEERTALSFLGCLCCLVPSLALTLASESEKLARRYVTNNPVVVFSLFSRCLI